MSRRTIEAVLCCLRARQEIHARVAVVVAHPDDEAIGLGPFLRLFRHLTLLHVTDGAPRDLADARAAGFASSEAYAKARRMELLAALRVGGCADLPGRNPFTPADGDPFTPVLATSITDRTTDRSAGRACAAAPFQPDPVLLRGDLPRGGRSTPDGVQLPVADQSASLDLAGLAASLRFRLAEAEVVFTHAFEGGHPDHDAVAFAVAASGAAVIEMAGYHATPDGGIEVGTFLGAPGSAIPLAPSETERRDAMLACFETQRLTLAPFVGWTEALFRPAPTYDFTSPPASRAYYDGFGWGMTSARWQALAAEALASMAGERPGPFSG